MGAIFAVLIAWMVFCKIIEVAGPELLSGIGYLIRFAFVCLWITLRLAARGVWWLATDGRRHVVRAASAAVLFGRILWEEWRRGDADGGADDETPADDPPPDPFDSAVAALGLPASFTKDELNRVYRQAIRKAHPDAGGTAAQAAAINAARDVILERMGWATARAA